MFGLGNTSAFLKSNRRTFTILYNMQNNPGDGLPVTGGLMHTYQAHEGFGGNDFISSPWMSTLLLDAVERYYIHSGDSRVPDFVMDQIKSFSEMEAFIDGLIAKAKKMGVQIPNLPDTLMGKKEAAKIEEEG